MADDVAAAYLKLTQTPLAKSTTCLGLSAATWTVIVGILSIIFNVLPGIIVAVQVVDQWDVRDKFLKHGDKIFNKHVDNVFNKDVDKKEKDDFFGDDAHLKYASIAMLVLFSVIQLIAAVLVIVGGVTRNPRFLYCWFCGFGCVIVFSRIGSGSVLFVSGLSDLALLMILYSFVDIVIAGLLLTSYMRLTGQHRNEKYLKMQSSQRSIRIQPQLQNNVRVLALGSNRAYSLQTQDA